MWPASYFARCGLRKCGQYATRLCPLDGNCFFFMCAVERSCRFSWRSGCAHGAWLDCAHIGLHTFTPDWERRKKTLFFEGAARSVVCGVSWQFKLVCVWLTVGELAVSRFFHLLPVNSSLLSSLYNTHTHIYTNINAQKKSQTSFILILVAWKPKENILIL